MNPAHHKPPEARYDSKNTAPIIEVVPALNVQSTVAIGLRLLALNFLLRVIIEVSTPILAAAGFYPETSNDTPRVVGWTLVGGLVLGAVLLWTLASPLARLVAKGLPFQFALGELSLSDCYALALGLMGIIYIISHAAPVWNWTWYLLQSLIHGPRYPWSDRTRGYQMVSAFVPFLAGILLLIKRKKWALKLAGSDTANPVISLRGSNIASEPIKVTIESRPR